MTVIPFRTKEHTEADQRAVQLPHRRGFRDPTDKRIESGPLGSASIAGLISQSEFNAGVDFGEAYSYYLDTIYRPEEYTDEQCEAALGRYRKGLSILEKHPKRVQHAVLALTAYGEDWGDLEYCATAAKTGLTALSKHF
jgi:hypothetical protein